MEFANGGKGTAPISQEAAGETGQIDRGDICRKYTVL